MDGSAPQVSEEMGLQKEYGEFFDLVLIDAKKDCVLKYFDLAFLMMRIKGVIMTDNMLYSERYRGHMSGSVVKIEKNPSVSIIISGIGNGEEITVIVTLASTSKIMVILSGSRK